MCDSGERWCEAFLQTVLQVGEIFMKVISMALLALGLAVGAESVHAQTGNISEFLFCDNCSTPAQFESVAKTRPTKSGEWLYAVGNRVTGDMRYVTVFYTPAGQVPLAIGKPIQNNASGGNAIALVPIKDPYVVAPEDYIARFGVGRTWATSVSASAVDTAFFKAVVQASSHRLIVNAPPGDHDYDSLQGAGYEVIGPYMYRKMTETYPGWAGEFVASGVRSALIKAIGWNTGKGPVVCLVFNNGDFGCFQLNPDAPSAPSYLDGTGKDHNGTPIDRSPSMPNGGNIGTKVVYTNGEIRYSAGIGSILVCGYVNGDLKGCYREYVTQ